MKMEICYNPCMFRMWGKIFKNNKMLRDMVVEDCSDLNRTRKIYNALEAMCREFDLPVPIWLEGNVSEFKRISKTRFSGDSFIEPVEFDYLEIQVIEEDY